MNGGTVASGDSSAFSASRSLDSRSLTSATTLALGLKHKNSNIMMAIVSMTLITCFWLTVVSLANGCSFQLHPGLASTRST